jgi:hypothetical protein
VPVVSIVQGSGVQQHPHSAFQLRKPRKSCLVTGYGQNGKVGNMKNTRPFTKQDALERLSAAIDEAHEAGDNEALLKLIIAFAKLQNWI